MLNRRGYDNCIDTSAIEHVPEVCHTLDIGIQTFHVLEAYLIEVAHRLKIAIRQAFEVANEIGTPISASNHAHNNWFIHIKAIDLFGSFISPRPFSKVHREAPALGQGPYFRKSRSCSHLELQVPLLRRPPKDGEQRRPAKPRHRPR